MLTIFLKDIEFDSHSKSFMKFSLSSFYVFCDEAWHVIFFNESIGKDRQEYI